MVEKSLLYFKKWSGSCYFMWEETNSGRLMLKGTQPGLCQSDILVSLLLHSAASVHHQRNDPLASYCHMISSGSPFLNLSWFCSSVLEHPSSRMITTDLKPKIGSVSRHFIIRPNIFCFSHLVVSIVVYELESKLKWLS